MQAIELLERNLRESTQLCGLHQRRAQRSNPFLRGLETVPYDPADDIDQRLPMREPERIGLWQGVAHGFIPPARTLIGPHEHIAKQLHAVLLVDSHDTVCVRLRWNIDK